MATPGLRPGFFIWRTRASISALTPTSASGVSTSTSAALPVDRHLDHGLAVAADQVARADVAFDRHEIGKEPARPQHRIAALALERRHHHQRALVRIEGGDQPVDQARHRPAACRRGRRSHRRHPRAPPRCRPSPRCRGRRQNPDCARAAPASRQARSRPARAGGRSPRSPAWRARPAPPRPRSAPAGGARSRRAACSVPPMRVERPAASTTAATRARVRRHRGLRARLRPGDDLHQQAAHAHPGDGLARHRKPGEQPHQHPVEAVLLGRARAARRAEQRPAAGVGDQQQIAGIDRHAEMLDASRRSPRPRPGSRRAGRRWRRRRTPGRARRPRRSTSSIALASGLLLVRHASLGDDAGAGGRAGARR